MGERVLDRQVSLPPRVFFWFFSRFRGDWTRG